MKKTISYTDEMGNKVPVKVKINKNLDKNSKKNSKLGMKVATTALVITLGVGTVLGACSLFKTNDNNPTSSTSASTLEENFELRFDPNSKECIVENAVLLIEEAAKMGKEIDAEDAILATIVANADEINAGFMGELFGERAKQTHTYNSLVDAYLKVAMMQVENIGIAKDNEIAFNIENIFANPEDYNYLYKIRELTSRYNNSNDDLEKTEITNELNKIAFNLCTYESYDISNTAAVVAMLSLDGMRMITKNNDNPILHDDIRDEMFGNGDYACQKDGKFTSEEGIVLPTAYSLRVSDIKLDSVKSKLDNAILEDGKTVILDELINEVQELTKDIEIADFDVTEEINKELEENRDIPYEYESAPGVVKDNYSEKTENDVVQNIGGKDVVVVPGNTTTNNNTQVEVESKNEQIENNNNVTNDQTKQEEVEVIIPTEPDITIEENVTPKEDEEVIDKGNVEENKQQAEEELRSEWEKAQADSNQGCIDGEYYGQNGLAKPSFEGKSEYYINAFNANYDFWYSMTQQPLVTSETYDLDSLSKEQLEELKGAAIGETEYSQLQTEKTK